MVLQGYTLDGSGAFRSRTPPPCTVWPRTVMRGKSRKLTSGSYSVPKSARRTEPSPRFPRFAANASLSGAKEGLGESRGGKGTIRCPCPLLSPPGDPGTLSAVGTASPPPPGDPGNPPPWARHPPPPWARRPPLRRETPAIPPPRGAKGDGIDKLFSCPITSSRFFSATSHFSRIYASGLRILTVLHDFLKNFYCKSRKHFGQLETHLCENYNSKHRDQPGTAGASGWIE